MSSDLWARHPGTMAAVCTFFLGNAAAYFVYLLTRNTTGFNDNWIFGLLVYLLMALSYLALFVVGGVAFLFETNKARGEICETRPDSKFEGWGWLLSLLSIPTILLHCAVLPFLIPIPLEEAQKIYRNLTLSPSERLNREFDRECLNTPYDKEKVRAFLQKGADINTVGSGVVGCQSCTILALACEAGDEEFVRSLLAQGADVNTQIGWKGPTAIDFALNFPNSKNTELNSHRKNIALLLIKSAANLNLNKRIDSLSLAINNHADIDLIKKMLDAGAKLDGMKEPPLFMATRYSRLDVMKELLRRGADPNAKIIEIDGHSRPILEEAIQNLKPESIKMLIDAGANVNVTTRNGRTMVMVASGMKWKPERVVDCINILLDAGAKVDAETEYGVTALSEAKASGNAAVVELLQKVGAR